MRKIIVLAVALAAVCSAIPAAAATVITDRWYNFSFGAAGSSFSNGFSGTANNPVSLDAPAPVWEFTLLTSGSITFVDGYVVGDQFNILDFGLPIGLTSTPGATGCGSDIIVCLNNPDVSQGTFFLAAGPHSISGSVIAAAPDSTLGTAFFIINSSVPEPSAWALMLLGFGGMGLSLRYRRRKLGSTSLAL